MCSITRISDFAFSARRRLNLDAIANAMAFLHPEQTRGMGFAPDSVLLAHAQVAAEGLDVNSGIARAKTRFQ